MFRLWCDEIYTTLNGQLLGVPDKSLFLAIGFNFIILQYLTVH